MTDPAPELPALDEVPGVDLGLVEGRLVLTVKDTSVEIRPYQALALAAGLVNAAHHPDLEKT